MNFSSVLSPSKQPSSRFDFPAILSPQKTASSAAIVVDDLLERITCFDSPLPDGARSIQTFTISEYMNSSMLKMKKSQHSLLVLSKRAVETILTLIDITLPDQVNQTGLTKKSMKRLLRQSQQNISQMKLLDSTSTNNNDGDCQESTATAAPAEKSPIDNPPQPNLSGLMNMDVSS
jgi:hypothetical protein